MRVNQRLLLLALFFLVILYSPSELVSAVPAVRAESGSPIRDAQVDPIVENGEGGVVIGNLNQVPSPAIRIEVTGPDRAKVGDKVKYQITVTNDGEIGDGSPISNVTVEDSLGVTVEFSGGDENGDGRLEVGEVWTFGLTYIIQADDPQTLDNTVIVTGQNQNGSTVSTLGYHSLDIEFNPAIGVVMAGPESASVGENLIYIITVTNEITITKVTKVEPIITPESQIPPATPISADGDGQNQSEARGAFLNQIDRVYILIPIFVLIGGVVGLLSFLVLNRFIKFESKLILGLCVSFGLLSGICYSAIYFLGGADRGVDGEMDQSAQAIVSTHTPTATHIPMATEEVQIVVVGDGSPISEVSLAAALSNSILYISGDINENDLLDAGESWIYKMDYTLLPTDPNPLINPVTVSGRDKNGDPVSNDDSHSLNVDYKPSIAVEVRGPASAVVGDLVTIDVVVRNDMDTGDGSPVGGILVEDSIAGRVNYVGGDRNEDELLDVGESWKYELSYTLLMNGPDPLIQSITVSGQDQDGEPLSERNRLSVDVEFNSAIDVEVIGPESAEPGDSVTFDLMISIDGEAGDGSPISNISVTGTEAESVNYLGGDSDSDDILEVGETWTYQVTYTVSSTAVDPLDKTVVITGKDADGDTLRELASYSLKINLPLLNGDFERRDFGWELRSQGLPVSFISSVPTGDEEIPVGNYAALLGKTDYACSPSGVPIDYAEISQTFTVPEVSNGVPIGLSFDYVIYSLDTSFRSSYDRFEVYINKGVEPVFSDGNQNNTDLGCSAWWRIPGPDNVRSESTSGWANGYIDLRSYRGLNISVSFQNHNRYDGWYNTYTYLDNVQIVTGE
jgi:uncharacterized repeat protein (TIGR01451 family)